MNELRQRMRTAAAKPSKRANERALTALTELGTELESLRDEMDEKEAQLKALKERERDIKLRELPELMEQAGLVSSDGRGSFTLPTGARIHLKNELFINVKAEDKPGLLSWLRKHRHKDLIKEDVHHQTLKAFCKEQLENEQQLPPQITTYVETQAVLTRAPKKGR